MIPPGLTVQPGSQVVLYFTHVDGSHSVSGSWTIPLSLEAADLRGGPENALGTTLGEAVLERILETDPGENGGRIVPVVSAEVVLESRVLLPWVQNDRVWVREWAATLRTGVSGFAAYVSMIDAGQTYADLREIEDERLVAEGYKLL